jgi:hypothetical protein
MAHANAAHVAARRRMGWRRSALSWSTAIAWLPLPVGSATEFFDVPAHKDIDTQTVVDLRRMLSSAGYGPDVQEAEATGQQD